MVFGTVDDGTVEGVDVRTLLLTSEDPSVDILTPLGQISILDNDGKEVTLRIAVLKSHVSSETVEPLIRQTSPQIF